MKDHPSELARLQAVLLTHLDQAATTGCPIDLQDLATTPEYQAWLDLCDPHMAHLAAVLVKQWGLRREQ